MKSTNKRIELNWGKLLGFNQVKFTQRDLKSKSAQSLIGAKIGAAVKGVTNTQPSTLFFGKVSFREAGGVSFARDDANLNFCEVCLIILRSNC